MKALDDDPSYHRSLQGSGEAFEALWCITSPAFGVCCIASLMDSQLTQDLCQETFLAAYRALPEDAGGRVAFCPWLYRIALISCAANGAGANTSSWYHFPPTGLRG